MNIYTFMNNDKNNGGAQELIVNKIPLDLLYYYPCSMRSIIVIGVLLAGPTLLPESKGSLLNYPEMVSISGH